MAVEGPVVEARDGPSDQTDAHRQAVTHDLFDGSNTHDDHCCIYINIGQCAHLLEAGRDPAAITRRTATRPVYRHQVEACAEAGPPLLAESDTPHHALARWIGMFIDFLATKHGLAEVLRSDDAAF